MLHLLIYCAEDDRDLTSAFFKDIGTLAAQTGKLHARHDCVVHARYRSYHHFQHMDARVEQGVVTAKPIPTMRFKRGAILADLLDFLKMHMPSVSAHRDRAVLVIQSHGYNSYIRVKDKCDDERPECISDVMDMRSLAQAWAACKWRELDAIILDSCCCATYDMMAAIHGGRIARYAVACQTSCPFLGFITDRLLPTLARCDAVNKIDIPACLLLVAQAMVANNDANISVYPALADETDAAVVDVHAVGELVRLFEGGGGRALLKRQAKHRVIKHPGYNQYDLRPLIAAIPDPTLASTLLQALDACISGYVHTKRQARTRTTGMSIEWGAPAPSEAYRNKIH